MDRVGYLRRNIGEQIATIIADKLIPTWNALSKLEKTGEPNRCGDVSNANSKKIGRFKNLRELHLRFSGSD
jgi:hypothetical protein